jgi:hypothetical protein
MGCGAPLLVRPSQRDGAGRDNRSSNFPGQATFAGVQSVSSTREIEIETEGAGG